MSEAQKDVRISQMDTYMLESKLANVRNLEEYEAIMQQALSQDELWKEEITALITETGLTRERIAAGCGVKRATAYNLTYRAPAKRENVLCIAILTGRTIDQTNRMLREWAGFSGLYVRNADDMIWYYLIRHGANAQPDALFHAYHAVYQQLFQAYQSRPQAPHRPEDGAAEAGFAALDKCCVKTIVAENILDAPQADHALSPEGAADDAVFADIVNQVLPLMAGAYERLFARLDALFYAPVNEVLWESKRFLSTYRRYMERFLEDGVLPKRSFLIALGIRLDLDVKGINDLLELANMGELNPRDKLECAVIFSLEAAYRRYPSVFHPDVQRDEDWLFGDDRQTAAAQTVRYESAAAQLFMQGLDDDTESLSGYIRRRLDEDGLPADGGKEVERFLEYL